MPTMNALTAVIQDLRFIRLRLRIGAPLAAQRAAFQKDSGADTGTVVNGKLLNVEYDTFTFHRTAHFSLEAGQARSLIVITSYHMKI